MMYDLRWSRTQTMYGMRSHRSGRCGGGVRPHPVHSLGTRPDLRALSVSQGNFAKCSLGTVHEDLGSIMLYYSCMGH